jgi:hypothetical protein
MVVDTNHSFRHHLVFLLLPLLFYFSLLQLFFQFLVQCWPVNDILMLLHDSMTSAALVDGE